ncbi:isochorismate synthase [Erwinia sp. CPCC 100877]|nr:isochorismate synthase [Erwinia sp. CPCC 100877]
MSVPIELIEAYHEGYRKFSWVTKINENPQLLRSYFEKGRKLFQGERFYWQTPDQEMTLVGFGKEQELTFEQTTFQQVEHFIKQEQDKFYQNLAITGTGALLFGAFPFDRAGEGQTEWGKMAQGLFYLPTFLLTRIGEQQYLTLTFTAENQEELHEKWVHLMDQFTKLIQADITVPSVGEVTAEEIGVEEWLSLVDETVAKLKEAGPLKKVVLARKMQVSSMTAFQADVILKNLQKQQSNTYFFVLEAEQRVFIGATPERLLKASVETFSTASIAGSVSRGTNVSKDEQLGMQLMNDLKNRQEHKIVVDRIVEELEKMTDAPIIAEAPSLLKNRDIQHLYVPITGKRQKAFHFLQGVQQLHPTPALGGEPKELALDWLKEHERLTRGLYGAPIGWIALKEDVGEFAVGIRSALLNEDTGFLYAGCGIVADSQAELERIETKIKFQPMLRGIGGKISDDSNGNN